MALPFYPIASTKDIQIIIATPPVNLHCSPLQINPEPSVIAHVQEIGSYQRHFFKLPPGLFAPLQLALQNHTTPWSWGELLENTSDRMTPELPPHLEWNLNPLHWPTGPLFPSLCSLDLLSNYVPSGSLHPDHAILCHILSVAQIHSHFRVFALPRIILS